MLTTKALRSLIYKYFGDNTSKDLVKIRAPGRINLIGEHIDYNDGPVMPLAISLHTVVRLMPREDTVVYVYSTRQEEELIFDLKDIKLGDGSKWGNYIKGVSKLLFNGVNKPRGFNCIISGNLQLSSGLSSSAALEISFALGAARINNLIISPLEMIKLCQKAEIEYANIQCGLMDQVASMLGKSGHIIYFDTLDGSISQIPFPKDYFIAAIASGQTRDLATSEYNQRRQECRDVICIAQERLGVSSFRYLDGFKLNTLSPYLSNKQFIRAWHVLEEIQRTKQAAEALLKGNMAELGELINQSHQSLDSLFEVSTSHINYQVSLIQHLPYVLGARLCGGGFGGYIIALVKASEINKFQNSILDLADKKVVPGDMFITTPQDGAIKYIYIRKQPYS